MDRRTARTSASSSSTAPQTHARRLPPPARGRRAEEAPRRRATPPGSTRSSRRASSRTARFLFLSERSGFFHLYRHAADGTLRNAVTKGDVDDRRRRGSSTRRRASSSSRDREGPARAPRLSREAGRHRSTTRVTAEPGVHTLIALARRRRTSSTRSRTSRRRRGPSSARPSGAVAARPRRQAAPARRLRARHRRAGLLHGRGRDALLHAAREARRTSTRRRSTPSIVYVYGGPHAQVVQDALGRRLRPRPPPRLEGLPRLDDGQPRLVGPRARLRDADPEEHGRAGAQGPARGRRRAEEAAVRRRVAPRDLGLVVRRLHDALRRDARGRDVQVRDGGRARRRTGSSTTRSTPSAT